MKYRVVRHRKETIIAGEKVHYVGGNLARAWREAFSACGLEERPWQNVLLIGMGASLIQILSEGKISPPRMTVLEIDPEMVRLQEIYFHLPQTYELRMGDAAQTIHTLTEIYDGLFVDAFVEEEVPEVLIRKDFVEALHSRLAPEGLLMWNVLRRSQSDRIYGLLAQTFPIVRCWRYAPHTFWISASSVRAFPSPF
ncbi:MAG: fused MFS/spermidine synthase [Bacteroidia bacterium]|nr:fused MFS/spermidine synthase [Bacteroidia bacterium]